MLFLQEIEQRRWGNLGGRGEGAVLQLPTDGVVHEGVTAGVPPGGGREAGKEEGSKDGNSGFSVVTFHGSRNPWTFILEALAQIYICKADIDSAGCCVHRPIMAEFFLVLVTLNQQTLIPYICLLT